jgi:hypothetical protein
MVIAADAFVQAARASSVLRTGHVPTDDPMALTRLAASLGADPLALVMLFTSPFDGARHLPALAAGLFGAAPVIGCTTAGEISTDGYAEGEIIAVGLPPEHFIVDQILIADLGDLQQDDLVGRVIRSRLNLAHRRPDWPGDFAFLLVDGLSIREDELAAVLASGLGAVPMFGGSAGDGTRFHETLVFHGGQALSNAAVLTLVRSACPVRVFSLDHLVPTGQRMVVTEADPARRIVRQINAEPAAQEYARILGKDPDQLTAFTFAAHPVVVRVGGRHHVRAIQRMAPNGDLIFFSAIDAGLVLTLAEPLDMVSHLDGALLKLAADGAPDAILACDCILRRIEAQEKQLFGQISDLLRKHKVVGFSTYGEQLGAMHVNQTMTGVAIYPPKAAQP